MDAENISELPDTFEELTQEVELMAVSTLLESLKTTKSHTVANTENCSTATAKQLTSYRDMKDAGAAPSRQVDKATKCNRQGQKQDNKCKTQIYKNSKLVQRSRSRVERFVGIDTPQKGKKLGCENWKRHIPKKLREKGEAYRGKTINKVTGKVEYKDVEGRKLDERCSCRSDHKWHKCSRFSEEERQAIFKHVWAMTEAQRRVWVSRVVDVSDVKERRVIHGSPHRSNTYRYYFEKDGKRLRVCKTFFLHTSGLRQWWVLHWAKTRQFSCSRDITQAEEDDTCMTKCSGQVDQKIGDNTEDYQLQDNDTKTKVNWTNEPDRQDSKFSSVGVPDHTSHDSYTSKTSVLSLNIKTETPILEEASSNLSVTATSCPQTHKEKQYTNMAKSQNEVNSLHIQASDRCQTSKRLGRENWKRNISKRLREKGVAYKGRSINNVTGNVEFKDMEGRELGERCSCTSDHRWHNCSRFSEEERQAIFKHVWAMTEIQRRIWVSRTVSVSPVKRRTVVHDSSRSNTYTYFLEKDGDRQRVCQIFFLHTTGLRPWWVKNWAIAGQTLYCDDIDRVETATTDKLGYTSTYDLELHGSDVEAKNSQTTSKDVDLDRTFVSEDINNRISHSSTADIPDSSVNAGDEFQTSDKKPAHVSAISRTCLQIQELKYDDTGESQTLEERTITGVKRPQRRTIQSRENWQRNMAKQQRENGLAYIGRSINKITGNIEFIDKEERKLGEWCSCSSDHKWHKCSSFSEEERQAIFTHIWAMSETQRRIWVSRIVSVSPVKRRTVVHDSSRSKTYTYFLEKDGDRQRVCQIFFLHTTGLRRWWVKHWAIAGQNLYCDDEDKVETARSTPLDIMKYAGHYNTDCTSTSDLALYGRNVETKDNLACKDVDLHKSFSSRGINNLISHSSTAEITDSSINAGDEFQTSDKKPAHLLAISRTSFQIYEDTEEGQRSWRSMVTGNKRLHKIRKPVKSEHWKKTIAKKLRERGEAYRGKTINKVTGKVEYKDVEGRKLDERCSCRSDHKWHKCSRFSEEERQAIFKHVWVMTESQRRMWVSGVVDVSDVKKRKVIYDSPHRSNTYRYYFEKDGERLRVCKTFFLHTSGLRQWWVLHWANTRQFSCSRDITHAETDDVLNSVEQDDENPEDTVISEDSENSLYNQASVEKTVEDTFRAKKRKYLGPENWQRNIAKRLKESGMPYKGRSFNKNTGKVEFRDMEGRKLGERCSCTPDDKWNKCSTFSEEERQTIFKHVWAMTEALRRTWVFGMINKYPVKHRSMPHDSVCANKLIYFLEKDGEKQKVCQTFFLQTCGLSAWWVQRWGMKTETEELPKVHKPSSRNLRYEKDKQFCKDFLLSLPCVPSHCHNASSSKLCLEPSFTTLADVYRLYKKTCTENKKNILSRQVLRNIFGDLNLSIFNPKKSGSDLSIAHKHANLKEKERHDGNVGGITQAEVAKSAVAECQLHDTHTVNCL